MDSAPGSAKASARAAEFSKSKPLPPIGSDADSKHNESGHETDRSSKSKAEEDARSTSSSSGMDRKGEASTKPKIVRGFRPEKFSDDEDEIEQTDKKAARSVSFNGRAPEVTKRRTYDGRELTMVTLDTQTDWDWVEEAEHTGTARTLEGSEKSLDFSISEKDDVPIVKKVTIVDDKDKSGKKSQSPKPGSRQDDDLKGPSVTPSYQMPYNDEYGIPILDLSSDTEDSSDEETSHKKMKDDRSFLPSVGPPNILQYQRESEKHEISVNDPESRIHLDDFEKDEDGMLHGMFSGTCEFCKKPIKPFPSLEQQQQLPPEMLYCCTDYREFVEDVLRLSSQLEEEHNRTKKMIDIKPHQHVGSKQERNAAKEKAVQRMREREMARRQQEASGMQQNFFASGPGGGASNKVGVASAVATPLTAQPLPIVARQMKTINYQLSSQKCLEEGWTLRPPSPLDDDLGDDVFIPEPLNPAMIADGKRQMAYRPDSSVLLHLLRERPLIEKYYEHGQKFLTMFPDGTGNVFYPSGNLAILISSVKLGQYYYTIHQDMKRADVAAAFEPNGYGYCYFSNGAVRLYIDQYGGIELDNAGGKKRKWSWKDHVTHVHAPPFQPICIGMNRNMGLRVMSQENIALTFSSNQRSCRFNMGSRLKLVAPENAPVKEVEEDQIFLEEKKLYVEKLLQKVDNLLKYPNNPKIDKMLPPLHTTNKEIKTAKMKKDRQVFIAQQTAREKKQASITANA